MARKSEFYKGSRKKRNYALVPFAVVLAVLALVVVGFYGMQKYAVVTKDGVAVELPILGSSSGDGTGLDGGKKSFPSVDTEIVFDPPDYSRVKPAKLKNVEPIRAIFVPAENLTEEKLAEYGDRLKTGNALVLEMKPRSGLLMFNSQSQAAMGYGMSASPEISAQIQENINKLKESGTYLVAQISCCIDNAYGSRSLNVALKNTYGMAFTDDSGLWLDPYSIDVRNYAVQLTRELYAMGFDEVVLADVAHPVIEREKPEDVPKDPEGKPLPEFMYSVEMSTPPGPVNAVCGFAVYVANQLKDREGVLSIYTNTKTSLVKADPKTGQDATLLFKLFDRVYFPTDKAAYSYNVSDVQSSILSGEVTNRFVPVVINNLPPDKENISWVLIDKEVKKD